MRETIWSLEPHTAIKHRILDRYIKAWLPIMSRYDRYHVTYIDGFAGPGIYTGGEPGSPIIVINAIINHKIKPNSKIALYFIEKDEERYLSLKDEIEKLQPSFLNEMSSVCKNGSFDESMESLLDGIEGAGSQLRSAFVFIDPFGFSDTPMSIIAKILRCPSSEALITFMHRDIDRFDCRECNQKYLDRLFGDNSWKTCQLIDDCEKRRQAIKELYMSKLKEYCGARYLTSFEMRDENDQQIYCLIHATNHPLGFYHMKCAIYSVDCTGNFRFSDWKKGSQTVLMGANIEQLINQIRERFSGSVLTKDDLINFTRFETFFIDKHLTQALKEMEIHDPPLIDVTVAGKRKGMTYPEGKTKIKIN